MSRNEGEYGDLKIPRSEWPGLKKAVRDAYNAQEAGRLEFALLFHARLVESAKGVRNADWAVLSRCLAQKWPGGVPEDHYDVVWRIFHAATMRLSKEARRHVDGTSVRGTAGRPPRPTKALYPDATNRTLEFEAGGGRITFDEKEAVVRWYVDNGNHAVRHARESALGKIFFAALEKVKWTARSGGLLYGNDEYNRESRCGGGGDYVTGRYGHARTEHEKQFAPVRSDPYRGSSFGRSFPSRF